MGSKKTVTSSGRKDQDASRDPTLARRSPGGEAGRVGVCQQTEIPPYPSSYAKWGQQKPLTPWVAPEMFSEGQIPPVLMFLLMMLTCPEEGIGIPRLL